MLLISYDISNDKIRTKFSKFLSKFGFRLQYSVLKLTTAILFCKILLQKLKILIWNSLQKRILSLYLNYPKLVKKLVTDMPRTKTKNSSWLASCKPHVLLEFFMKKHAKMSILTVTNAKNSNTQYRCINAGVWTSY